MKHLRKAIVRLGQDAYEQRGFVIAFFLYDIAAILLFGNFCPSVYLTGLPCPGCGTTRAVFYFLTGQFEKGWSMNPMGIFWLALAAYFCLMRYWLGKNPVGVLQIGGVLAVCMMAVYIWRMLHEFPGETPIAYTQGNLLEMVIPGYRNVISKLVRMLAELRILLP